MTCGASLRQSHRNYGPSPFTSDLGSLIAVTAATVTLGTLLAWPIWSALVRLFLPARLAKALLDWQQSLASDVASLARQ